MTPRWTRDSARGPVKSKGPEAINRQLDTFKAAIRHSGAAVEEAFVPVLAPGWLDHFIFNEYYQTEDEFLFALADALREEYRAMVAAGFNIADRRSGLARLVGHAEARTLGRGLSPIRPAAHRCRQSRARRHSRGKRALPLVLGQLARPAHP